MKRLSLSKTSLIKSLVQQLGLKVTVDTLTATLRRHPDYPSLAALSDVLHQWHVPNLAVRLQPYQLAEITYPAVAHLTREQTQDFVILQTYAQSQIHYQNTQGKTIIESIDTFAAHWTGIVLLLEPNPHSGDPNYATTRRKERLARIETYLAFAGLCAVALAALVWLASDVWLTLFWILIAIGLVSSGILLSETVGKPTPLLGKICTLTQHTDCQTVITSESAKVFGWLSWAEIGFLYFAGVFLLLTLAAFAGLLLSLQPVLLLVASMALPYTVFSVYTQAFVLGKWCMLCLIVQTVLVAQFLLLSQITSLYTLSAWTEVLPVVIFSFGLPIWVWFLVKPFWQKSRQVSGLEKQLETFKRNSTLFRGMLQIQRRVETADLPDELILGNPQAAVEILMVSHPFCPPCRLAHAELHTLLAYWGDAIKLKICLLAGQDSSSVQWKVVAHLLRLSESPMFAEALWEWYQAGTYEQWAVRYPVSGLPESAQIIEQYSHWAKQAAILHTPTFFINGYELVAPYSYTDLNYHIRALLESSEQVSA